MHVNVLRRPDLGHFAAALATGLAQTHGRRLRRGVAAASVFRRRFRVTPAVELGDDGKARSSFAPSLDAKDAASVLEDIYRLLAEGDRPGVLVLDEFDAIVDLGPKLPNAFKGFADSYPQVLLVVAGSRHHMMEQLVHVHGAPLYSMTQPISLGPIDPDAMACYLMRRSAAGGKKMPRAIADTIIERIDLATSSVQRAIAALVNDEWVTDDGGLWHLTDPFQPDGSKPQIPGSRRCTPDGGCPSNRIKPTRLGGASDRSSRER